MLDSGRSIDGIDISSYICTENSDMMMEMECLPQLMLKYEPMTVPKSLDLGANQDHNGHVVGLRNDSFGALDVLNKLCDR